MVTGVTVTITKLSKGVANRDSLLPPSLQGENISFTPLSTDSLQTRMSLVTTGQVLMTSVKMACHLILLTRDPIQSHPASSAEAGLCCLHAVLMLVLLTTKKLHHVLVAEYLFCLWSNFSQHW